VEVVAEMEVVVWKCTSLLFLVLVVWMKKTILVPVWCCIWRHSTGMESSFFFLRSLPFLWHNVWYRFMEEELFEDFIHLEW